MVEQYLIPSGDWLDDVEAGEYLSPAGDWINSPGGVPSGGGSSGGGSGSALAWRNTLATNDTDDTPDDLWLLSRRFTLPLSAATSLEVTKESGYSVLNASIDQTSIDATKLDAYAITNGTPNAASIGSTKLDAYASLNASLNQTTTAATKFMAYGVLYPRSMIPQVMILFP
jgi:hypothetical protein